MSWPIGLKATRVYDLAKQQIETRGVFHPPPWYTTIQSIPPGDVTTRTLPIQHQPRKKFARKTRKPSRMFMPQLISYEEDAFRKQFFQDHPWELARPRQVLENEGRDGQKADWRRIEQPHIPLSGESVVQRQLWLIYNEGLTKLQAYDKARKEFYQLRQLEDVERRVAKEEALYVGANFGEDFLRKGMKKEDERYENWKAAVSKEMELNERIKQAAHLTARPSREGDKESLKDVEDEEEDAEEKDL